MTEDHRQARQVARYAVGALALLKFITLGIALEQGVLAAWAIAVEVALLLALALVLWQLPRKPARWIVVGAVVYLLEIAVFAVADPISLIQGFFLKTGVLGVLGWCWWRLKASS